MSEEQEGYAAGGLVVDGQPARGSVGFRLGLPPSVNHQYARTARGVRLTAVAKAYRDRVAWIVRSAGVEVPDEGSLCLLVRIEGEFRGDGDNRLKLLADAVAAGLGIDDGRFRRHTVDRAGGEGPAWCEVTVWW